MKKKSQLRKLMILLVGLALCTLTQGSELAITVVNPSFELPGSGILITDWSGIDGWSGSAGSGTGVEKNEYYSPVDGEWYAFHAGSDSSYTYQLTDHTITAGERYTLKVWARSINGTGNLATTTAEVRFYYGSTEITSVTQNVNPVRLLGVPRDEANDDGGNVWIDQGYRHEFADIHMYQNINADPLTNSWYACWDDYYDYHNLDAWAVGPVIVPGHKWVYGVNYDDRPPGVYSEIRFIEALSGGTPAYNWTNNYTTVLYHVGDEDPWVIDPHLYYDDATGRLWMSWGGGTLWVCEMDPTDGMLINHPSNKEFDAHPEYHTAVAYWNGDEWSSEWFEGPALYKHNGYWYLFGSYGHLALNYTIRMGRGTSPTGPFYDKDGIAMTQWDSSESEYGNTLILGADGGQANPGHPHIWEENGKYYMGYDYTDEYTGSGTDRFGIRRLYWVDDWPVVAYTPIEVTFNANHYPAAIGQKLGISVRNVGLPSSDAAFDYVSLTYTPSPQPTPDIDGSGDVNFVDYSLFAAQWMRTDCNDCNGADFTNDGNNVDYNDLDVFVDNWLRDYGLLGYWQLDGDANDSSGYGNDGTVQGGADWLDDPNRGWCLSLGGGDYVQIPADVSLNAGKITMAAWVKVSNPTPATAKHVLNRQMTKAGTYVLWLTSPTPNNNKWAAQIRLDGDENNAIQIYSNDVATTDWTHIAATYDGSVLKMYINGILQTDTVAAAGSIDDDNSGIFTIGAHPDPKNYFIGLIDEVIIYDKALNQQQIEELAGK